MLPLAGDPSGPTTPPSVPVHVPDTVIAPRQTPGLPYRSGRLECSRTAVLNDLGKIPVIPVTLLLLLLPRGPIDPAGPLEASIKETLLREKTWFFSKDPDTDKRAENIVFKPVPTKFKSIVKACGKLPGASEPSVKIINNPNSTPGSIRNNTSRPDGYFLRKDEDFKKEMESPNPEKHYWEDIAVPMEYKKFSKDIDRHDNSRKIIWSMHHILRNDPCRRFTFGITIENTEMSVWLCHRAGTCVSEPFDIKQELDTLVKVVSSLAFADVTGLGWDPTFRRKSVGKSMQFEINVEQAGVVKTFIASEIISDFGAEAMQGRGTRVFKARNPDDNGVVVVKDVWQDYDRLPEGTILDMILEKMKLGKGTDFETEKQLFLTVIYHGDVMIGGRRDHTRDLIMQGEDVPGDCEWAAVQPPPEYSGQGDRSVGNIPHLGVEGHAFMGDKRGSQFYHRVHYRIVFAELCAPLYQLEKPHEIFQALIDGTKALELMYNSGFVHRDVSAGNILFYQGRGRLTDLEYAKCDSFKPPHDVRTGTPHFTAVEVAHQEYLFSAKGSTLPYQSLKYNALHDVESIWWIVLWIFFVKTPVMNIEGHNYNKQLEESKKIFPGEPGYRLALINHNLLKKKIELLPTLLQPSADIVCRMVDDLLDRYAIAEKGSEIDAQVFKGLHSEACQHLQMLKTSFPNIEMKFLQDAVDGGAGDPKGKRKRIDISPTKDVQSRTVKRKLAATLKNDEGQPGPSTKPSLQY